MTLLNSWSMKRQKEGVALAKRLRGHEEEGFARDGKGSPC